MCLDKCRSAHCQSLTFSTLLWLPTCSLSEPEKWGMASPEGLREFGFWSVITSLRGRRRSNHRLTGVRETHPWLGGGGDGGGAQTLRSSNTCFSSVLLSYSVQSLRGEVGVWVPPATETHKFQRGVGKSRPGNLASEQPSLCGLGHNLALSDLDFPSGKV